MSYSKAFCLFVWIFLNGFMTYGQIELGEVQWLRDFETAKSKAQKNDRLIFILFQEVPGCITCQRFGADVMSDPWIVETLENEMVPLCIYNNKRGEDERVLKNFQEPSWNNPVMQICLSDGHSLGRLSGVYTKRGVVSFILDALKPHDQKVPQYLTLYHDQLLARETGTEILIFSTACFWSGEGSVGDLRGLVSTESGWMNGREVVKIEYNPLVSSFENMLLQIKNRGCLSKVYTDKPKEVEVTIEILGQDGVQGMGAYRRDDDTKYYLQKSKYAKLELFDLQASRLNACLMKQTNCDYLLSTRQKNHLKGR